MTNYRMVNGRKFVWDGQAHLTEEAADQAVARYRGEGFETEMVEEAGKFLAYTRREAKKEAVAQPG